MEQKLLENVAAEDRLAGEVADVEASIELVSSGVATRITLTGLRFGREIAERLSTRAAGRGVELQASAWPEDAVCDIQVALAEYDSSPTGALALHG